MFTDTSAAFSQTTGLTVQALCLLREREREIKETQRERIADIQKRLHVGISEMAEQDPAVRRFGKEPKAPVATD